MTQPKRLAHPAEKPGDLKSSLLTMLAPKFQRAALSLNERVPKRTFLQQTWHTRSCGPRFKQAHYSRSDFDSPIPNSGHHLGEWSHDPETDLVVSALSRLDWKIATRR